MRTTTVIGFFGILAISIASACSDDAAADGETGGTSANAQGGNAPNIVVSGGKRNNSGGGTANRGSGNNGSGDTGSGDTGSVVAESDYGYADDEDAVDGMKPLTETDAKALQSETDPGKVCTGWAVEPELDDFTDVQTSLVVFVVDVSSTMNEQAPLANGTDSRWHITRDALRRAIESMPDEIWVGVKFFPNKNVTVGEANCVNGADDVSVGPLSETRQPLYDALGRVEAPSGGVGTPIHDAFNAAVADIRQNAPADLPKYIALMTDGQPTISLNCSGRKDPANPEPTDPIVAAISAAANDADPVKTFMIGAPGSDKSYSNNVDYRGWLSASAREGGTAPADCSDNGDPRFCHFDLTQTKDFALDLQNAFNVIMDEAATIKCNYTLPETSPDGAPIDPTRINIIYNDTSQYYMVLPDGTPDDCVRGWRNVGGEIEICGDTCNTVTGNANASMTVLVGCESGSINQPVK